MVKNLRKEVFYSDLGKLKIQAQQDINVSAIPFKFLTFSVDLLSLVVGVKGLPNATKALIVRIAIKILSKFVLLLNRLTNSNKTHVILEPSFQRFFKELHRFCLTHIYSRNLVNVWEGNLKDHDFQSEQGESLVREGVVKFNLTESEAKDLKSKFKSDLERLFSSSTRVKNREFDRSLRLDRTDERRDLINQLFVKHNVFETCAEYFKYEVKLGEIILHVSQFGDKHHFETASGLGPVRTQNFHFDPKLGRLKIILYLSSVKLTDGPFEYVPTTHRIDKNSLDRLIWMKAISITNYLDTDIKRQVFNSLPNKFRRTAIFGSILHERLDLQDLIRDHSVLFTGDSEGTIILFDPNGFHRGGFISSPEGSRVNLQITLEPADLNLSKHLA